MAYLQGATHGSNSHRILVNLARLRPPSVQCPNGRREKSEKGNGSRNTWTR